MFFNGFFVPMRLRPWVTAVLALGLLGCGKAVPPSPQQNQRVITLAPHLAELVCVAAGCGVLVAVSAYSDYPPEVRRLPAISDVAQLHLEAALALQPTQVIAWDGGTPVAQLARLEALQLPVTVVRITQLDHVADALVQLGQLLGSSARANAAAADYRQRLQALRTKYAGATPLRVLYQIETAPVYSINRRSPISEAITLCGGINVFADLPTLSAPVSDESVLAARPQVVIHGPQDVQAVEAYWARFALARSAAPQRVAIDPDLLARSGPRLIEGVEQLCTALDALRSAPSTRGAAAGLP